MRLCGLGCDLHAPDDGAINHGTSCRELRLGRVFRWRERAECGDFEALSRLEGFLIVALPVTIPDMSAIVVRQQPPANARSKSPRSAELFTGIGGLALGLARAGFEMVELIERDEACCETLRANSRRLGMNSTSIEARDACGVRKGVHAAGRYSWSRPPSRSRRRTSPG